MITIRSKPTTAVAVAVPEQVPPKSRLRPIHYWSALGVFFLGVQIYVYASWVFSDDFYRQPTGADLVPTYAKVCAWLGQSICLLAGVAMVVYLWRRSRREGQLAWDVLIAIGFASIYWQDPILNFARPNFFYNSYLINFGSWTSHIPGWLSPYAGNLPEPILMIGPLYAWLFVLFGILFCALARQMRRFRPDIGKLGIFLAGFLAFMIFDLVMETICVRTQIFAYPGVINSVSLFPGHIYQFPLYETLVAAANGSIVGMIRLNRDDRGRSVIERGVDELHVGARAKTSLRILAAVGMANGMFMVTNNLVYIVISFYISPMPHFPSYLNNDMCGVHTSAPCPGPGVPVLIDNTPHRTGRG